MKVDELLLEMTLDERIGQLNLVSYGKVDTGTVVSRDVMAKIAAGQVGGVFGTHDIEEGRMLQKQAVESSRLGIPLLFGLDVIHGHKTIFPIPLALACSWNLALIERTARMAASEATAEGVNWIFSPMVDIARDPRWGRVAEGAGEDAWLGSQIARAMVRGLQGDDLSRDDTAMACVKHLGLYGAVEAGRDYNSVDMSAVRMFEDYLPPYRAAVEAGVGSVMTAFNDINGMPATANAELFRHILRDDWGFTGLTVTDYTAINEMMLHGLGDLDTVSALAINAGIDMDMVGEGFLSTLKGSVESGAVSETQIDNACRRILEAKRRLGLFDDPYRYFEASRPARRVLTKENRATAREVVRESCVLLKNENAALPLSKDAKVALVGPLGDDIRNMLGTWSIAGDWENAVSLRAGMEAVAGGSLRLHVARGANISNDRRLIEAVNFKIHYIVNDPRDPQLLIDEALEAAAQSDVIVAAVGEAQEMSGESASRADISIPEPQRDLLKALKRTGKPLVLVVFSGRPLTLTWEEENADAILHVWFAGTEAGNGIADLLFGDANPSGKLTMTFPHHVGQVPIYYNNKNTGRPLPAGAEFSKFTSCYLDVPNTPLYPFGYGLSYTQFEYGPVTLDSERLSGEDAVLHASVVVRNAGDRSGAEIVQLYVSDPMASITRPVKSLRGCEKIWLEPGEEKTVVFAIRIDDLKFYNLASEYIWEPGEFIIQIGPNSRDTGSASVFWDAGAEPVAAREESDGKLTA